MLVTVIGEVTVAVTGWVVTEVVVMIIVAGEAGTEVVVVVVCISVCVT